MTEQSDYPSAEMLNALLDDELSADERAHLLAKLHEDKVLSAEFCELRMIKDAVQLAHMDVQQPKRNQRRQQRIQWFSIAAALALFVLGILLGGGVVIQQQQSEQRFAILDPQGLGQAPAQAENEEMRIVFHLTHPDIIAADDLLDEVEVVLDQYQKQSRPLRIEVVANNDGLNLFRKGLTVHAERIAEMSRTYPNLTFVACQNTIQRLKVEDGIEVVLIPQARVTGSGVNHVAKRQQEGWAYIRL